MLFEKIYKNLCERGKNLKEQWEPVGSGLERHRILPKHQGGTYVDLNCTYLTLREHAIAHYLLWRINGNVGDRDAYQMMSGINPNNYPSWLGRKHTPEAKKKMSEAMKGDKHPNFGKTRTPEARKKISESMKGDKNHFYGKKHSPETIRRFLSGENNPMYGRTGDKNPMSKKIKVTYLEIENIYSSISLASKDLDINYTILKRLASGLRQTSRKHPGLKVKTI